MLWNELLRKGNVSLLQSRSDTQYCVCKNYNPKAKEDQQYDNGSYFCYFEDKKRKPYFLANALDAFRYRTEENYITRSRLEELASKFADGLMQDDKEAAMEYFTEECEMEDYELEFFGIETENEDDEEYIPSAESGDYSPSNPWNAPGMSISDFI